MTIYVNDNGSWRTITASNPGSLNVYSGGAWRTISSSYIKDASTWRFVYGVNTELWSWGYNRWGILGQNTATAAGEGLSSPVQLPGTTWNAATISNQNAILKKSDGTLWATGRGFNGALGQGGTTDYSSPVQIPGTTWSSISIGFGQVLATKTDGTLWTWGLGNTGKLGQNSVSNSNAPVQIPGTTWRSVSAGYHSLATKTDGTLWSWGYNAGGQLGQNNRTYYSSPVQIPGTTWNSITAVGGVRGSLATKTDGTLWAWGSNTNGQLGQNNTTQYSSPVQIPGTTWSSISAGSQHSIAIKTDGTLWSWGYNGLGELGQGDRTNYSSPRQVPGTTWSAFSAGDRWSLATKTDNTLWVWGYNVNGQLGLNSGSFNYGSVSLPNQIPGTQWSINLISKGCFASSGMAFKDFSQ